MRINCATDTVPRPRLNAADFVPARGAFTFPAPYGTRATRVTNADDGAIEPCGYAYWRQINAHAGRSELLVFAGGNRQVGGPGPQLYAVDKASLAVRPLGPLFPEDSPYSWCTGEGWYFSAVDPDVLYVKMPTESALHRLNVVTREMSTVFDVANTDAASEGACYIWQCHSSQDDRVHSGTLKNAATYGDRGSFAYHEPTGQFAYFPQKNIRYDECQIDKSGRFLLIKDNLGTDQRSEVDNRIIDVASGTEQILMDVDGAGGHSDNGFGSMIATDNFHALPRVWRLWEFDRPLSENNGRVVYHGQSWDVPDGHISFSCARPGDLASQRAFVSTVSDVEAPRANEIVQITLDGSLEADVLAPVLTDLDASGGGAGRDQAVIYRKFPKANSDPYGEWIAYTSNLGGNRLDLLVLQVPL